MTYLILYCAKNYSSIATHAHCLMYFLLFGVTRPIDANIQLSTQNDQEIESFVLTNSKDRWSLSVSYCCLPDGVEVYQVPILFAHAISWQTLQLVPSCSQTPKWQNILYALT